VVAALAYAGVFGAACKAFFGFIALLVAFGSAIAIAYVTRGRFYIARPDLHYRKTPGRTLVECSICERSYEAPDMAHCPFYRAPICSLCCGLELHCHDFCKRPESVASPIHATGMGASSGIRFEARALRRLGRFLGLLSVAAVLLGSVFLLTYRFMDLHGLANDPNFVHVMERLYAATLAVTSLGIWWIVLSQERQDQSERELLEAIHHLEHSRKHLVESEMLASLGGLVAGVAHEINTPAGILVSSASYLSDRTQSVQRQAGGDGLDVAAQQQYLRDAAESSRLLLSNAQRVAQLVMSFKQLAVDRISETRQSFDLRDLLQGVAHDLQPKVDEAGAEIRIVVASDIILQSFPMALSQVVTNLSVNALQHAFGQTPDGGCIIIEAELHAGDEIRITCSDNGCGIDPAIQARMFEPFVTTRRMLGGSGLGLHIVNQIVTRQLNGTITMQTSAQGTRFVVQFPRLAGPLQDVVRILASRAGSPPP